MVCNCGFKMKCTYSVAIGRESRHRVYHCLLCGQWKDTIEISEAVLDTVTIVEIKDKIHKAIRSRAGLIRNLNKRKGGAPSSPAM